MYSIAAASILGFGAALVVHWQVGYTDFLHLLPVYVAAGLVVVSLLLSRDWFTGTWDSPANQRIRK